MFSNLGKHITRGTLAFNAWLGSTMGFVQSIVITILWVPLVVLHIDPHGQLYLYIATSLSLITQFSVAIYARHLESGQAKFETYVKQMLQNQADLMKYLVMGQEHIDDDLEDIKEGLGMEHGHGQES